MREFPMSNQYVDEAPYHPGYEDAAFKNELSPQIAELMEYRKMSARHLQFSNTIVQFCKSDLNHHAQQRPTKT
jgi:hypothetical protein